MIAKISTIGSNPAGLLGYLFGPGRRNEHTDPHLVAASDGLAEDGWRPIVRGAIAALARDLDAPHRLWRSEEARGYVWHCSLSIGPDDRHLTDQEWAQAARYVMTSMKFDASEVSPCRWVAVRHGLSAGGNDHIHLVVDLVREDGLLANRSFERRRMSAIAATLERRFGLQEIEGRSGAGLPGVSRTEIESTARAGKDVPDRIALARIVRAAAAYSSEASFVRKMRDHPGIILRPRYAEGGQEEVVGYSIALRPRDDTNAVWFGGGKLAADLTLPRLRALWMENEQQRREAVVVWAENHGGNKWQWFDQSLWAEAAERIVMAVNALEAIPIDDRATWAGAAHEAASLYAAFSTRLETGRSGPLARAAAALAYSAQTRHGEPQARRHRAIRDLPAAAMVALQTGAFGHTAQGQIAFHEALIRLTKLITEAHRARGEAQATARLTAVVRDQLIAIRAARLELASRATPLNPAPGVAPHSTVPSGPPRLNKELPISKQKPGLER